MRPGTLFCLMVTSLLAGSTLAISQEEKPLVFTKFPVERPLAETNYFKINNLPVDGLCLYADSLLFIRNATGSSPNHFSLFNLRRQSFLSAHVASGGKYGQATSFISYGVSNGYLWAYDIMKDKIILSDLDQVLYGKNNPVREMAVPSFYYSIQLLNDSGIVASGDYDSDYKVAQLTLSTGHIEKQIAPWSFDPKAPSPRARKMGYESFLLLQPSGGKCALACRYADQLEIIDLDFRQSKIIKGPENYEPAVMVMKGNDGKELSARNSDTRYAFVKGKVTDQFIYLLYSGNNHNSSHLYYGKSIYVYDWNGNPVQKINLTGYVLDFVVTKDDSLLYTYDPASNYIQVARLKN